MNGFIQSTLYVLVKSLNSLSGLEKERLSAQKNVLLIIFCRNLKMKKLIGLLKYRFMTVLLNMLWRILIQFMILRGKRI